MKTIFYTSTILFLMISCRSVDKMVEKGEYDRAFQYSISKLQGEKNKKTEYVKALEKAYFKLNGNTIREIEKLQPESRPENWPRVLSLYQTLEIRQEQLEPLMPLKSESGYKATFDMKSYRAQIIEAEDNTCLYYYENARQLMARTERTGDKTFARQAYDELNKIDKYKRGYKDAEILKEKALRQGLVMVLIEVSNGLRDYQSNNIERELLTMPLGRINSTWLEYTMIDDEKLYPDYIVTVELNNIVFSPERERYNNYVESKEILVKKDKVKEKRDSGEVWVEKEVYEKVKAEISEIFREKKAELNGRVLVTDMRTNEYVKTIPVNVFHDFVGYGCKYIGDERALTDATRKKIDPNLEMFPPDDIMAQDLAVALKNVVMTELKQVTYR